MDCTRQYYIVYRAVTGSDFFRMSASSKVTLVTQASLDFLHWFPEAMEAWAGPVSIALFLVGEREVSQTYGLV